MEGCESSGGRGGGEGTFFARALVRSDVDPHCSGLGTREADGCAIVIEVRDSVLFECPAVGDVAWKSARAPDRC